MSHDDLLNQVLVNVSRSLLQYVGECWPWTGHDDIEERAVVSNAVYRQRDGVQALVDLLADRDWAIDFGAYPTEYTDLHFVKLDYLLPQLVTSERSLAVDLERAVERCHADPEAADVLERMLVTQNALVREIESLAASGSAA